MASSVQFTSVSDEISYWLAHTSSTFKGGYSGSGENGNDFAMPVDTPVYAIAPGTVVGSGYYGGGGVVSIQENGQTIWYYQHLDQNVAQAGQFVQPGQLIGYSGGQNSGGSHPSTTEFSTYPHIEVGINAPWSGIWGNSNNLPNTDPRPMLTTLEQYFSSNQTPTGGSGVAANGIPLSATQSSTGNCGTKPDPSTYKFGIFDPQYQAAQVAYAACIAGQQASGSIGAQVAAGLGTVLSETGIAAAGQFIASIIQNPTRALKFIAGGIMVLASIIILILPDAAAAGVALAGFPEASPAVYNAVKNPLSVRPSRTVAHVVQQRQLQRVQAANALTAYRKAQEKEAQKRVERAAKGTTQLRHATPTRELPPQNTPPPAPPVLPRPRLGPTINPMTPDEIATAQRRQSISPVGVKSVPTPTVQRAPRTGLTLPSTTRAQDLLDTLQKQIEREGNARFERAARREVAKRRREQYEQMRKDTGI